MFINTDKMFTQIGNSEYYEGVWYKITNPEALYKEKSEDEYKRNPFKNMRNFIKAAAAAISNPNNETNLVGYYASESFNSVTFYIDRKETLKGDKVWRCEMFLDTRECGVDYIVEDASKEKVVSKAIEVLKESGAVVDADKERERIKNLTNASKMIKKNIELLNLLIDKSQVD